jgi:hypothetical protein
VNDDGLVLVSAVANGQIQTINYRQGAFVPANSNLAVVNVENGMYVSATYKLSAPDYARINKSSKIAITLPDNKTLEGKVYDISLETVNKEVMTTVRARITDAYTNPVAFSIGTPVKTVLSLDTTTWYSRIVEAVKSLFRPTSGL